MLAALVGGFVGRQAALAGSEACGHAGPHLPGASFDPVCYHLVHTLAGRLGLVSAVTTVVITLMMVGLSRTAQLGSDPTPR